jgi:putative addiction module component (TIGR02574 family)
MRYHSGVVPDRSIRLLGSDHLRRISTVTKAAEVVLSEALELTDDERAAIAAELIASLDGQADEDVEKAWAAEIERRMAALDAGTSTLTPWWDVKRRIEREILKK